MLTAVLIVLLLVAAGAGPVWYRSVPKLGPNAYRDDLGWHETSIASSTSGLPDMQDAMDVCRAHDWLGYIRWRDYDGARETDPCKTLAPVEIVPVFPQKDTKAK